MLREVFFVLPDSPADSECLKKANAARGDAAWPWPLVSPRWMASCTRTPSSCRVGCPGKEAQSQRSWRASAVRRPELRPPARSRGCPDASAARTRTPASSASGPFPVTPDASSVSTSSLSDADAVDFASTSFSSLSSTDEVPVADAVIPRLTLAAVAETKTFRVDVGREPLLVEFEINGTRALAVGPTSPLAGIVRAGDVLVGVNGRAVSGASLMKVLYVEYRRQT